MKYERWLIGHDNESDVMNLFSMLRALFYVPFVTNAYIEEEYDVITFTMISRVSKRVLDIVYSKHEEVFYVFYGVNTFNYRKPAYPTMTIKFQDFSIFQIGTYLKHFK